ncbi:Swt1 family HEPN domain-containing protein [Pandoraea captiosa]|uniref:Swt1 family HEPN domain-containing protein n=1 Tax=Pandoraea captiosa TaxID=2508302 RepID=UPI001241D643|nr:Swt1 family HEPN domain-containing protein [Pandoraea captiosa]
MKSLENAMRDFIQLILERKHGANWMGALKVTPARIEAWKERRTIEQARLGGKALDERLLYYADFYDIRSILRKHWDEGFAAAFGDLRTTEVFLEQMEKLRDPNAHRRELTSHQKWLIAGISGELRTRIVLHRGKGENVDDYFPLIELARDNLGNFAPLPNGLKFIEIKNVLRVGDSVEFQIIATDPYGADLKYSIHRPGQPYDWSHENNKTITFDKADIGKTCDIQMMVKSTRGYTAFHGHDDLVQFRYTVLPAVG